MDCVCSCSSDHMYPIPIEWFTGLCSLLAVWDGLLGGAAAVEIIFLLSHNILGCIFVSLSINWKWIPSAIFNPSSIIRTHPIFSSPVSCCTALVVFCFWLEDGQLQLRHYSNFQDQTKAGGFSSVWSGMEWVTDFWQVLVGAITKFNHQSSMEF